MAFLTYLFSGMAARAVRILGTAIGGDGEEAYLPHFFLATCAAQLQVRSRQRSSDEPTFPRIIEQFL